jgi:hypothetical protein
MRKTYVSPLILPILAGLLLVLGPSAQAQQPMGQQPMARQGQMTSGPAVRQSCAQQYQSCMEGCKGITPGHKKDEAECKSMCDQLRSACR